MSSCKKWNSCNDKCKRNSGRRGGGNGVIGKDGATGPTGPQGIPGTATNTGATGPTGNQGPTGLQGPTGPSPTAGLNAMIPYEPYNQNNKKVIFASHQMILQHIFSLQLLQLDITQKPEC